MKKSNIAPGLILITIGVLYLLRNMGYIDWWTIGSLFRLWPLVLVVVGINIIFRQHPVVTAITWVTFLIIAVAYSIMNPVRPPWHGMNYISQNITEDYALPMDAAVERGTLKMSTGALKLWMGATEGQLLEIKDFPWDPEIQVRDSNGGRTKDIVVRSTHSNIMSGGNNPPESRVYLNKDIAWNIEANLGAASSDMDLTDLNIERLKMDVGAGDFRLRLTQPEDDMTVDINAGASQVVLELPRDVNARVSSQNVLAQVTLDGSYWNQDGKTYYSVNYDAGQPTIDVTVKMGVGHLEIISR